MFKMDYITYAAKFNNEHQFAAFRDKNGWWHFERRVVVRPQAWDHGYMLVVTIEDLVQKDLYIKTERIDFADVYDHPTSYDQSLRHAPVSLDDACFMRALTIGDIRGDYANTIVYSLFFRLCDKMAREHLPLVVAHRDSLLTSCDCNSVNCRTH